MPVWHLLSSEQDHDVTVVIVENAETFVDSLICNFNVYIIIIASLLLVPGASNPI